MQRQIYRVAFLDGEEPVEYLSYSGELEYHSVGDGASCVEVQLSDVTLPELTEFLDRELEGANYHRFVGVNAELARIVESVSGHEEAKEVLWKIAQVGGLDELSA